MKHLFNASNGYWFILALLVMLLVMLINYFAYQNPKQYIAHDMSCAQMGHLQREDIPARCFEYWGIK